MKIRKNIIKALLLIVLIAAIVGVSWYEVKTIEQKEHDRQYTAYNEIKNDISLNLNLAKVAIMTKDTDLYHQSITNIDNRLEDAKQYPIIQTEQAKALQKVQDYNNILKSREAALREMASLYAVINTINETVSQNFGNAGGITRDSLKGASGIIEGLFIDTNNYHEKTVLAVVEKVNQILTQMRDSANKLSGCIDNCYQENIVEISNEMSNSLGKMVEGFPEQNKAFIEEFQLNRLSESML